MRSLDWVILSVCACAISPVLADNPGSAAAAAPAPVSSASAAPPPSSSSPTTAATAAPGDVDPARVKELRSAGYKPETQNGQTLWCRKEAATGTVFKTKTCNTADQLAEQMRQSQDFTKQMQRQAVTIEKGG